MPISLIGTTSAAGNTFTMPTHQTGDLIVVGAFIEGGNVAVTPAPAGWTAIVNQANANASQFVAFKQAASSGEVSGTWTNGTDAATELLVWVLRGTKASDPIGASAINPVLNGSSFTFPALTLDVAASTSWVLRGGYVESTVPNLTAGTVAGYTFRQNPINGSTSQALGIDSDGVETAVTADSIALGSSYLRGGFSVEILAEVAPASRPRINNGLLR